MKTYFAKHVIYKTCDKELISRIYKELMQLNSKQKNKQPDFLKIGKRFKRTLYQRRQMSGKKAHGKDGHR